MVMIKVLFTSILLSGLLLSGGGGPPVQTQQTEKVIVVQLDVQFPEQAGKCYTSSFDKKKIELAVEFDDTINFLPDFVYEEDPIEGPGCFMPQMKLIFQDYTYVLSLYCTSVLKYKNSAPFVASSSKMENDLEITESVLVYLKKLHRRYFGIPVQVTPTVCQRFLKAEPLDDDKDDIIFDDDNEDDNVDLEKDVNDNQGMFDTHSRPDEDPIKAIEPDDE